MFPLLYLIFENNWSYIHILRRNWYIRPYFCLFLRISPHTARPNTCYCHTNSPIVIQAVYLCCMFNNMHLQPAPVVCFAGRTLVAEPPNSLNFSQCLPSVTLIAHHQYAPATRPRRNWISFTNITKTLKLYYA